MDFRYDITMHGPLLDGRAPGIADQMIAAVTEHITDVARDTVLSYSADFKSHPTWRWEMDLTGVVLDPHHGRIYDTVPYTAWLEGVSSRNMSSRFKGYHMWKYSAAWLQQTAGAIAQTVIAHWMPFLGGVGAPEPGAAVPPIRTPGTRTPPRPGWVPWENSKYDPDNRRGS